MLDGTQNITQKPEVEERYAVCQMVVQLTRHADGDPDVANRLAIAIRSICEDYSAFVARLCSPELVIDYDHVGNDHRYRYRYMIRILDNQDKFKTYHEIPRHVIATLSMMIEKRKNEKSFGHFDATKYFLEKISDFVSRGINDRDLEILKNIEQNCERNVLSYLDQYGIVIDLAILQEIEKKKDDQIVIPFEDQPQVIVGGQPRDGNNSGGGVEDVPIDPPGVPVDGGKKLSEPLPNKKPIVDSTVFLARLDYLSLKKNIPSIWTVGGKSKRLLLAPEARKKIEANLDDYRGRFVQLTYFEPTIGDYLIVTLSGMKKSF